MRAASKALAISVVVASSPIASSPIAATGAPLVTGVAVTGMPATGPDAEKLAEIVRAALSKRGDVKLIDKADEQYYFRSVRPKRRRSRANLRAAQKYVKQAETSFQAFDFPDAQKNLQKARTLISDWVGLKDAVDTDRQRLQLAVAIAHAQRDERNMRESLMEYAVRFPNEPPPPGLWPPEVTNRLKSKAPADSVLNLRSDPKGLVYIDGREVGTAPIRLGALPEGAHRVEVFLPNYFSADESIETVAGKESMLEVRLLPDLSSRLRKATLDRTYPPDLMDAIRALTQALQIQLLVAAGLDKAGRLVVRKIDLSPGAHEAGDNVVADDTPDGAALAVTQLFEPPEKPELPGKKSAVPMWAWIGGGAGAAVIGAGVVLRLMAVGTHNEFELRQGALTQAEAYDLRDRANGQSTGGAALIGVGIAGIVGIGSFVIYDLVSSSRHGS